MFRLIIALSVLSLALGTDIENDDRIVNGRAVSILEFPYQVSLQKYGRHFCGGSILGPSVILTAAHCLIDIIVKDEVDKLTVRAGSTNWDVGGVVKSAERIYIHQKFNRPSMDFDVGVVIIQGQYVYSATIKPVTIATSLPTPSSDVVVSGWGRMDENNSNLPTVLQAVELAFLPTDICRSPSYDYRNSILDSMICAVGPSQDSCQGDSGGPLNIFGTHVQVGVVSWGAGCALQNLPGVYCDLTNPEVKAFLRPFMN